MNARMPEHKWCPTTPVRPDEGMYKSALPQQLRVPMKVDEECKSNIVHHWIRNRGVLLLSHLGCAMSQPVSGRFEGRRDCRVSRRWDMSP